ncbi:hypothetical protein MFUM_760011 [Methylacidiphilum fumariolicum SolV]|uniref:Uncharacterized protein n=2 Tax=Candidatus Methylacidiphilum fumarolicum TaxID=591154 RepID=I0JZS6_METFB|nr:conserved protein of unknown function [Candidatus Methylacidiphilum fumarolicum]CCG92745.1 hypothetical protein MFUM_760011 [Methylacidiphilum fumariolicum SolV]
MRQLGRLKPELGLLVRDEGPSSESQQTTVPAVFSVFLFLCLG